MEKKLYMKPLMEVVLIGKPQLLAGSGVESDDDVYDVSTFITGSDARRCKIVINGENIKNITEHKTIEALDVFDDDDFNLINSIVENRPEEIVIENFKLPKSLIAPLKKIAKVVESN